MMKMSRGHGKKPSGMIIAMVLLLMISGVVAWHYVINSRERVGTDEQSDQSSTADLPQPPQDVVKQETLSLAVQALVYSDGTDFSQAAQLWHQLAIDFPNEEAFRFNEAVTVLKWIAQIEIRLSAGFVAESGTRAELSSTLEEAYERADDLVDSLSLDASTSGRATYLQATLLATKASRLPYPEDVALRKRAAQLLATALEKNPAQPLLACKLDELVQFLGDGQLARLNADALYTSWKENPRNLFLLKRAMSVLLENEDARLGELLQPSIEITKPLWSEVASYVAGINPEELLPTAQVAIENGQWNAADLKRVQIWLNIITGMSSGYVADARLVRPDVVALLDTSFLPRLTTQLSENRPQAAPPAVYNLVDLESSARVIAWFDYDLDMDFELVVLNGNRLFLYEITSGALQPRPVDMVELGFSGTGALVGDFFVADDPRRTYLPTSVMELMQATSANSESQADGRQTEVDTHKRHDTFQELLVWSDQGLAFVGAALDENGAATGIKELQTETGLSTLARIRDAVTLDIESDGDLDLVLATADGLHIMQNNGNRTFRDVSEYSFLGEEGIDLSSLTVCDFENDLDQDIIAVSPQYSHPVLLENLLHGQLRLRELSNADWPEFSDVTDLKVAELDGNSSWDFVVAEQQRVTLTSTRTVESASVVPLGSTELSTGASCLAVFDFNNDTHLDVLAGGQEGLRIHYGGVPQPSSDQFDQVVGGVSQIEVIDCNRDGAGDIACIENNRVRVLMADKPRNASLSVRVRGHNDIGGGGRVNHFSVGSTVELWCGGRQQRRYVQDPVTVFGLAQEAPEFLRIKFPNGLVRVLENPPVNALVHESQELKSSCPFLYGWNGTEFVLITDCLWNAPLGLQIARGKVMPDRRWENLLIPGRLAQQKDGAYELRVTEELWEFAYLDHVQLTAIDHPRDTRVFTNEKVGPATIAQHQLFFVHDPHYPVSATDSHGRDVLVKLQQADRVYVQAFDQLICQGLTEPHYVELDLGQVDITRDLRLFVTGWVCPTDTSLNIGISQNPDRRTPESPSLWVVDAGGNWVCAKSRMGFPGGKPKSIVVDLNDVFLCDDHRIRIGSCQQIYWDEMFIAYDTPKAEFAESTMEVESAELRYRGYSKLMDRETDQPHWYDYQHVSTDPRWPSLDGPLTRYGDVREILINDDDRMVLMTAGDELVMRFAPPEKAIPQRWSRDFVLHSTGWDKDADLNTIAGRHSLPLPFANQKSYPPPPEQAREAERVWRKNEDHLTRE